jgi:hypothetical protein
MDYGGINTSFNTLQISQLTPLNSTSTSERDRFISELNIWKNKVQGENREEAARRTLDTYDEIIGLVIKSPYVVKRRLCLDQLPITELPPLPPGLFQLSFIGTNVTALPENLPPELTYLEMMNSQVETLPESLPAGLTWLGLARTKVTTLPENLPKGLIRLHISDTKIAALPENLPTELTELFIRNTKVTALPENLPILLDKKALFLDMQDNVKRIHRENEEIKMALLQAERQLLAEQRQILKNQIDQENINLVSTMKAERDHFISELDIWKNKVQGENRGEIAEKTLKAYDQIIANPSETVTLYIYEKKITELPPLPLGLKELDVSYTPVIALPKNWPARLKSLTLRHVPVTVLPTNWPAGLKSLTLKYMQVTALPGNLPAGLEYMNLSNTPLTTLPDENLPPNLESLNLSDTQVAALPAILPVPMRYLNLSRTLIIALPENLPVKLSRSSLLKEVQKNFNSINGIHIIEEKDDTDYSGCLPVNLSELRLRNSILQSINKTQMPELANNSPVINSNKISGTLIVGEKADEEKNYFFKMFKSCEYPLMAALDHAAKIGDAGGVFYTHSGEKYFVTQELMVLVIKELIESGEDINCWISSSDYPGSRWEQLTPKIYAGRLKGLADSPILELFK